MLYPPDGKRGVLILGHPGPVFCRRLDRPEQLSGMSYTFYRPMIGLDGNCRDPQRPFKNEAEQTDPFTDTTRSEASKRPTKPSFQAYFPYERSKERVRARVGVSDDCGQTFDVEVRKIGGAWHAVECWLYGSDIGHGYHNSLVPLTVDQRTSRSTMME